MDNIFQNIYIFKYLFSVSRVPRNPRELYNKVHKYDKATKVLCPLRPFTRQGCDRPTWHAATPRRLAFQLETALLFPRHNGETTWTEQQTPEWLKAEYLYNVSKFKHVIRRPKFYALDTYPLDWTNLTESRNSWYCNCLQSSPVGARFREAVRVYATVDVWTKQHNGDEETSSREDCSRSWSIHDIGGYPEGKLSVGG